MNCLASDLGEPKQDSQTATHGRRSGRAMVEIQNTQSPAVGPPDAFAVGARHDGDAVIVVLAGEFDLANASRVRAVLSRALSKQRPRLILDLSNVTFIDSGGLHVILEVCKRCADEGPALTVWPGPPSVQRVFQLTSLLDYVPFEPQPRRVDSVSEKHRAP